MKIKKKVFSNTCKLSYHDINTTVLLLGKGVYPYEYMGDWEKFNEHSYQNKKIFTVT